eukprot:Rmarinus@m.13459
MAGEGWDTQADYIRQKDRKLKEQYLDEFRESRETNSLFRGVSVWVNGRTPGVTAAELKAIICGGGGTWEAYYRRSKVTHVIASTLPVEKLKVAKSLPPVVTAEWVLDSKRAGRLLPVHQYIIPALRSPLKKQGFSSATPNQSAATGSSGDNKGRTAQLLTGPRDSQPTRQTIGSLSPSHRRPAAADAQLPSETGPIHTQPCERFRPLGTPASVSVPADGHRRTLQHGGVGREGCALKPSDADATGPSLLFLLEQDREAAAAVAAAVAAEEEEDESERPIETGSPESDPEEPRQRPAFRPPPGNDDSLLHLLGPQAPMRFITRKPVSPSNLPKRASHASSNTSPASSPHHVKEVSTSRHTYTENGAVVLPNRPAGRQKPPTKQLYKNVCVPDCPPESSSEVPQAATGFFTRRRLAKEDSIPSSTRAPSVGTDVREGPGESFAICGEELAEEASAVSCKETSPSLQTKPPMQALAKESLSYPTQFTATRPGITRSSAAEPFQTHLHVLQHSAEGRKVNTLGDGMGVAPVNGGASNCASQSCMESEGHTHEKIVKCGGGGTGACDSRSYGCSGVGNPGAALALQSNDSRGVHHRSVRITPKASGSNTFCVSGKNTRAVACAAESSVCSTECCVPVGTLDATPETEFVDDDNACDGVLPTASTSYLIVNDPRSVPPTSDITSATACDRSEDGHDELGRSSCTKGGANACHDCSHSDDDVAGNGTATDVNVNFQNTVTAPPLSLNRNQRSRKHFSIGADHVLDSREGIREFIEHYFRSSRLHFIGSHSLRREPLLESLKKQRRTLPGSGGADPRSLAERFVVHVDMDCFFVTVSTRGRNDLLGKPVAVAHSGRAGSSGTISAANYEARRYGVKSGSWAAKARAQCPQLVVLPYDFPAYEEVSSKIYEIFYEFTDVVESMSIDEAYLEIAVSKAPSQTSVYEEVESVVRRLRLRIEEVTQCQASAGIARNKFLARVATKRAKPNGQCLVRDGSALGFLQDVDIGSIPGVGWKLRRQFDEVRIATCADLLQWSKQNLQSRFGSQLGLQLYQYARGIDNRPVDPKKVRKSIGAELSWAIRFRHRDVYSVCVFIEEIAKQVACRMRTCGARGHSVTLKLKRRAAGATETVKYMGHGHCDTYSRTAKLPTASADPAVLAKSVKELYSQFLPRSLANEFAGIISSRSTDTLPPGAAQDPSAGDDELPWSTATNPDASHRELRVTTSGTNTTAVDDPRIIALPEDVRGIGLQVSKLVLEGEQGADSGGKAHGRMDSWLVPTGPKTDKTCPTARTSRGGETILPLESVYTTSHSPQQKPTNTRPSISPQAPETPPVQTSPNPPSLSKTSLQPPTSTPATPLSHTHSHAPSKPIISAGGDTVSRGGAEDRPPSAADTKDSADSVLRPVILRPITDDDNDAVSGTTTEPDFSDLETEKHNQSFPRMMADDLPPGERPPSIWICDTTRNFVSDDESRGIATEVDMTVVTNRSGPGELSRKRALPQPSSAHQDRTEKVDWQEGQKKLRVSFTDSPLSSGVASRVTTESVRRGVNAHGGSGDVTRLPTRGDSSERCVIDIDDDEGIGIDANLCRIAGDARSPSGAQSGSRGGARRMAAATKPAHTRAMNTAVGDVERTDMAVGVA